MDDLKRQAERFGADIRNGIVTKADLSKAPYTFVVDDEKEITADTVIISTGATAKYLGLEDEKNTRVWVLVLALLATAFSIVRNRSCSRWWRYCLRRSCVPGRTGQQGISCGT